MEKIDVLEIHKVLFLWRLSVMPSTGREMRRTSNAFSAFVVLQ